jgi:hypothetical protein
MVCLRLNGHASHPDSPSCLMDYSLPPRNFFCSSIQAGLTSAEPFFLEHNLRRNVSSDFLPSFLPEIRPLRSTFRFSL